ncbi:DNA ligase [Candidatus Micrarchaeota archaeon CG10_big_fil_rev_8_21_14_0_10_45_29]|nr:MAG: DNA ligase [Candidatus Micrarchaeota archaeon CG10_big_fil_rev_8_21_14_0_10_45_29]
MLFEKVAAAWDEIEAAGSRIRMAEIFASLISDAKEEEAPPLAYMTHGILLPPYDGLELGIGEKLCQRAICLVSGHSQKEVDAKFKKMGDLGLVAKWALEKKRQMSLSSGKLALLDAYEGLVKLAKMQGKGSQEGKIKEIAQMLNSANACEAKYIARFCVGKMRLGIAEPTMMDALAMIRSSIAKKEICALMHEKKECKIKVVKFLDEDEVAGLRFHAKCDKEIEAIKGKEVELIYSKNLRVGGLVASRAKEVEKGIYDIELKGWKKSIRKPIERAYNLCSDLGLIAKECLFDYERIGKFKPMVFSPIRPALAERLTTSAGIIEKIGKCAVEGKYDGFRLQVHKKGERVELYSRKLEKVSHAFPEIVDAAHKLKAKEVIFEGEALAYNEKEERYYSFQMTIQRKRKYGIEKMQKDFPLKLFAFDIMYLNGEDCTLMPYERRRQGVEALVKHSKAIAPTELKMAGTADELENFFAKCIDEGLEGVIAKDLQASYVAGAREFAWIKLKKSYGKMADTLDVVVVGYYLGEGQRAEFNFGGLLAAVRNESSGELETVAKIGSGFSEEEMAELGKMLAKLKLQKKPAHLRAKLKPDFWVEPKIVISVSADEISLSNVHTCGEAGKKGYALRFPRMVQIREDKGIGEISTTSEVERMHSLQKNKGK